jgi:hypothetical protein
MSDALWGDSGHGRGIEVVHAEVSERFAEVSAINIPCRALRSLQREQFRPGHWLHAARRTWVALV